MKEKLGIVVGIILGILLARGLISQDQVDMIESTTGIEVSTGDVVDQINKFKDTVLSSEASTGDIVCDDCNDIVESSLTGKIGSDVLTGKLEDTVEDVLPALLPSNLPETGA